jgi:peptide/nickel transport system substrate-binding protein
VRTFRSIGIAAILLCGHTVWAEDVLRVAGLSGKPGGRLIFGQRSEPKTLNPLTALDAPAREVLNRLHADLVHINRSTLKTEPALAKSYKISPDGSKFEIELRRGLKFSDGQPFDADDVVFTFQVYLDPQVNAPQRSLWVIDGKTATVRKLDAYRVSFELPQANAVGERIFDSVPILPRHLLETAYREGRIRDVWGLRTPGSQMAGLGPFRLKEYAAGQRVVLEKNPYYWKTDADGTRLPYLNELVFTFAAGADMQVMRFQAGESDTIARITPKDYAVLAQDAERRGYIVQDAGASLDFSFLVFNLNDTEKQKPWARASFRRAVSDAIDRQAIVKLTYQGLAEPIASPVGAGNRQWVNAALPKPVRSVEKARNLLAADGFKWSRDGSLLDSAGNGVQFSILASSTNPERIHMATLIQADLKPLGIRADVVQLEPLSLVDRVSKTRKFDAAILAMSSADADPNVDINFWLSKGTQHAWNSGQTTPATAWEAEIDRLMGQQMVTRQYAARKRLFDRVQQIGYENAPAIPLVTTHLLVGAKKNLGNFHPAVLEPYTLWNAEELYWKSSGAGTRK